MRTLNEILSSPCTPTEYLEKKRAAFKTAFSEKAKEVLELGKNPSFKDSVLKVSENYMKNLYVLPGTQGEFFFVGDPPAWNVKAVSDEEYLYSLNRLHGILPLCRAYILTGDEKYGKKVEKLAKTGYFLQSSDRIALSERGFEVSNMILAEILDFDY